MNRWRTGIMLRTALLCWLVTLMTLSIFVAVILQLQTRILLENMEAKAQGVADALRELTAGAAMKEDYSSIVAHCKDLLQADRSLVYLVVTKNDGFSLIRDRSGWRAETFANGDWRPPQRVHVSGIRAVSIVPETVFHHSQPFDDSGVEWGWIHVGLSLERYNRSVRALYQRTALLAILCLAVSLVASVLFARWLVRPILNLHKTAQDLTTGNLFVLEAEASRDELGSLAGSINALTKSLTQRDQLLGSMQFAAQQLLSTSDWTTVLDAVLAQLGEAAAVSRVQVVQLNANPRGTAEVLAHFEWLAPGVAPQTRSAGSLTLANSSPLFRGWLDVPGRDELVTAFARDLTGPERDDLDREAIKSLVVAPIRADGVWWGNLALDDCEHERRWSDAERASVRALADMLGAAIARQSAQAALLEAGKTLEQRVAERTQELREQVAARERAHVALTQAQEQLVAESRQAGMAEVATGVLHNVGNALNSINVSTTLTREKLDSSEAVTLARAVALLEEHAGDLANYLTTDPKGRQWPGFVGQLAGRIARERDELLEEHALLARNVEHIREIVALQHSYARVSGVKERLAIAAVVDNALQMNIGALALHGVRIERHYEPVPEVVVDKHRVLQILVNLVHNAKYAMDTPEVTKRVLRVDIALNAAGQVGIVVRDTGRGIPQENLTRIFSPGFSTRLGGRGFGLHHGAQAAREMGGQLTAFSAGSGQGAVFTLQLPVSPE